MPSLLRTIPALPLLLVAALAGCATEPKPLDASALPEPKLVALHAALEKTIKAAHDDPATTWHAGGWGNVWVNFWGGSTRGLCHEWQEFVYASVLEEVDRVGWRATGVGINVGSKHEHHAVVVYDPRRIRRQYLLHPRATDRSWVLDAWRRGEADIYRMDVWLTLPERVDVPAELEDLDALLGIQR